jgi:hypothetical protein
VVDACLTIRSVESGASLFEGGRRTLERVAGHLEVLLTDDACKIVIRQLDLKPDGDSVNQIVLSPRHARHLASLLMMNAEAAEDADDCVSIGTASRGFN